MKFTRSVWVSVAIVLGSVLLALFLSGVLIFETLELKSIDARFGLRGHRAEIDSSLVVVAIDDASFLELPSKWPFPRSYWAKAIRNLSEAGARLIVMDVELTEPSHKDPQEDEELVQAVREAGNVILAGKIVYEAGSHGIRYAHLLRPFPELARAGRGWGVVNALEDADGFIRRYMLYQRVGQDTAYSIAVQAYRALNGLQDVPPVISHDKGFCLGDNCVPHGDMGSMYINYAGPAATYPTYSLAHILDDAEFDLVGDEDTDIFEMHKIWGTFKDKIVFIGASAEELQDNKYTPFFRYMGAKQKMPGVETHVNALATLLHRDYIHAAGFWLSLLILLLAAGLVTLAALALRPFVALGVTVLLWIFYLVLSVVLFSRGNLLVPVVGPMLAATLAYLGNVVHRAATQEREKRFYRDTFAHYVPRQVVDQMLDSGRLPQFGGERREMTVLFSDIRSFTTYSEAHSPEEVVDQLSEYLTAMVDVIFANQGTLDKFVGDEIMALFGAPLYYEDHALRACRTAVEMLDRLKELHEKWRSEGKPLLRFGVGINTGKMIVGNLGSKQLFDYTVIGDNVNVGARLEGTNKKYGTSILMSESTYLEVKNDVVAREIDMVKVKGKTKPLRIYELMAVGDAPPDLRELAGRFEEALQLYRQRRWSDALQLFYKLLKQYPDDGPSTLYVQRCLDLMENPPGLEWTAVTDLW